VTWIRVDAGISSDPEVLALRVALGCSMAAVLGHLTALWLRVGEHSPEAGKIKGVPDPALEGWALWDGESGRFAQAYRQLFQDRKGCVKQWFKYNGRYFKERREDAERQREKRRKPSTGQLVEHPPDVQRTTGGRPPRVRRISTSSSSSTNIPPKSPTAAVGAAGPSGARAAAVGDQEPLVDPDRMRDVLASAGFEVPAGAEARVPEGAHG
jgi:hypothetical protein